MARRPAHQEPQMVPLTPDQMKKGIVRLERVIKEIQTFDPQTLQSRSDPQLKALETAIEGALSSVFGHNSVAYNRYRSAASLDNGPRVVRVETSWMSARGGGGAYHHDTREAQQYVTAGKERSIQLLLQAVRWLEDELADHGEAEPVADTGVAESDLAGLHPQVKGKCETLYEAGEYAEAVEKSFKVVRDRLRVLTGHETGSEAFGKGKLHIRGAAASNVDFDFNAGAKFLMMSIDMFRNEKSHTSDARIADPVRAQHYLMLSSLAMFLLEDAEIRP